MLLKTGVLKNESVDDAGVAKRLFSTFHLVNSGLYKCVKSIEITFYFSSNITLMLGQRFPASLHMFRYRQVTFYSSVSMLTQFSIRIRSNNLCRVILCKRPMLNSKLAVFLSEMEIQRILITGSAKIMYVVSLCIFYSKTLTWYVVICLWTYDKLHNLV